MLFQVPRDPNTLKGVRKSKTMMEIAAKSGVRAFAV